MPSPKGRRCASTPRWPIPSSDWARRTASCPTSAGPSASCATRLRSAHRSAARPTRRIRITAGTASIDFVADRHDSFTRDYRTIPHTVTSRYARLGDLLELTVTNRTLARHPFHLHGFSFQPLAFERQLESDVVNGVYTFDYLEFVDTIDIPAHYTLRLRVRLDDRPQTDGITPGGGLGRWVFHCHILFHASLGMQSELVVVAPDGNERPLVDADAMRVAVR